MYPTTAPRRAGTGPLTLLFCAFVLLFSFAATASAEKISYPGADLRTDPVTNKRSLYPDAASKNTVTVTSGSIPGAVVGSGAVMDYVTSSKNTVKIKGGTVKTGVFGTISQKTASKNTVSVSGKARIYEGVYGAMSVYGDAVSNKLTISRGTVKGLAVGGASENKTAKKNAVVISGGTVKGLVAGGYSEGHANSNTVTVKKGSVTEGVAGGTGDSSAQKNKVTITGGTVSGSIAGGASNRYAYKNTVSIKKAKLKASVAGGITWLSNTSYGAVGNKVTIDRSSISAISAKKVTKKNPRLVTGGMAVGGSPASKNSLTLSSAVIGSKVPVAGGYSISDYNSTSVSNNKVRATKSTIKAAVYGGYSESGNTTLNSVAVSGGATAGNIYGGYSRWSAIGNKVSISSGTHKGNIYGGMSTHSYSISNTVTLSGGTFNKSVYGGYSKNNDANNNRVAITGGSFAGHVYGGVANGYAGSNSVTISGGSFNGNIIGGQATLKSGVHYANHYAFATGNTVTLSGAPNLANAVLYGARLYSASSRSYLASKNSSNTLAVNGYSGSVRGLYSFENYKFQLPKNVANNSTVISSANRVSLDSTKVSLTGFASGANGLAAGNVVTLIKNTGGTPSTFSGTNVKRGVEVYNFSLVNDSGNLKVKVDSVSLNAKTSAFTKDRAETLDLLTRGADLVAEQTMASVRQGAALSAGGGGGLFMFGDSSAAIPGVSWGSEGKISSSLAGLGLSTSTAHGTLALGTFFESGWTDQHAQAGEGFDSTALRDREQSSYGSGVLARFDHTSGLYAEGAVRYGKARTNFSSDGFRDGFGNRAAYEGGSNYTSFHTGLGYVYPVNDSLSVEPYSKLFVTRLDGSNADVLGDRLNFKASESRRVRSGAKVSYDFDEWLTVFAGLAHEYEADGMIRAQIAGYNLERDGAHGHSAMIQAGFSFKPVKDSPVSLYMDYRGYTGARNDANASAGLVFEF